ncbi:SAVED domain-containing protein [Pseudomonas juntendi]|uniref:SAVED domain-containing protein n=1 Tax=Pseudomonas juntendi TaxID=2666183 RepID=A0A7W2Q8I5_9PSED|nr:SAVED domain-containing protein [Pseudomonas juntendi]MBA6097136.1 SAVED domain-containing protein [Pseudomonas juntendi]
MPVLLDALYDRDLKATLELWQQTPNCRVVMAYESDGWRFAIVRLDSSSSELDQAITGDLGELTKEFLSGWAVAKAAFSIKLELHAVSQIPVVATDATAFAAGLAVLPQAKATKGALAAFVKSREALLSDLKRPGLPEQVVNWVYSRSAGICEFEGCDAILFKDDRDHYGYYGYLAHIVAAKAKGPRGDEKLSAVLSQSPENIMLCCDVHHRLIDKVDPDSYSRKRLEAMVASRVMWRTNQVKTLAYPVVHALAFIGDIAGRTTTFSQHDARKALLQAQLNPASERVVEYLLRDSQGGNDVNDPGYWSSFLRAFRSQILHIHDAVRGHGAFGSHAEQLAIFPLGNMPAMLLGGWLIGEARRVELFSFRRNHGTWVRPEPDPAPVTFAWTKPDQPPLPACKVLITLELTAEITDSALNDELLSMPRIRIVPSVHGVDVVVLPEAMEAYRVACHEAWAYVTDVLKASEVCICAIAPAAAVFAFGMKLQARLHPLIHMYQMAPQKPPFRAFSLGRHTIIAPHEPPHNELQLEAY